MRVLFFSLCFFVALAANAQTTQNSKGKKDKKTEKTDEPALDAKGKPVKVKLSKEEKEKEKQRLALEKELKSFESEYNTAKGDSLSRKERKKIEKEQAAAEKAAKKDKKGGAPEEQAVSTAPKELAITYFDTDKTSKPIPLKKDKPQQKKDNKPKQLTRLKKKQQLEYSFYALRVNSNPDSAVFSVKIPQAEAGKIDGVRFKKAIELIKYGFYDKALPLLKAINASKPGNPNVNYYLGIAYFKGYGDVTKALPHFIIAAQKTKFDYYYKDPFKNINAPVDALLYVAEAYHRSGELSEAERNVQLFLSVIDRKNDKDMLAPKADLLLTQIRNAQSSLKNPKGNLRIENLGEGVNSFYADLSPQLLPDGELLFSSARPKADGSDKNTVEFNQARFFFDVYSAKTGELDVYGAAQAETINTPEDELINGITSDRKLMYLFKENEKNQDYFISLFSLDAWQTPEALFQLRNTLKWGKNYTVNSTRDRIIFASNQLPGSFGGYDLYILTRFVTGDWSEPINLGSRINTPHDEDYPSFHPNDQVLFFSSNGLKSIGGFDIFRSRFIANEVLESPESLGEPTNTYGDDIYYKLGPNGKYGYYSKHAADGFGDFDIYRITYDTNKVTAKFVAPFKNTIQKVDLLNTLNADIALLKNEATGELTSYKVDRRANVFKVFVQPCAKYTINYSKQNSLVKTESFVVPCDLIKAGNSIGYDTDGALKVGNLAQSNEALSLPELVVDEKERLEWQLTYNGENYAYPNIELHYLNSSGYITKVVKTNEGGAFPYFNIPMKDNFIFEVQVPDMKMCGNFKAVLMRVKGQKAVPVPGYSFAIRCYL